MDKKEFAAAALNTDNETFEIYIIALNITGTNIAIYSFWIAQIKLLKANKAPITIPADYSNYTNIFLLEICKRVIARIQGHVLGLSGMLSVNK